MIRKAATCCVLFLTLGIVPLPADWPVFGGNPQRTGWNKEDSELTKDSVKKLKLEWSLKLNNESKELNALTIPIVRSQVITPRGFKEVVVVAGARDKAFAIDADTGKLLWEKQFSIEGTPPEKTHWLCPAAQNATPAIVGGNGYFLTSDGKLHALNLVNGEDRFPPAQFVPAFGKTWSLNVVGDMIYTTTSQGCNKVRSGVYGMDLKDTAHPVTYFAAGPTGGAGIWGRGGAAVGADGSVYVETGDGPYAPDTGKYSDTFIKLSAKNLKLADYYTPANRTWITKKDLDMGNFSPVVFPYKDWEIVAGSGKEGIIFLLDSKKLGGDDHRTPLFRSPLYSNDDVDFAGHGFWGAFSTAEDDGGTRWLFAPCWGPPGTTAPKFPVQYGEAPAGSIMAFKLDVKETKPVLVPAWMSQNMSVPEPVVIHHGVVFAVSNGENVKQVDSSGRILTSPERATAPAGNAILYALDMETGKELFSSGKTIPDFTHFSAPVVAGGRIYVVTHDSTVYAFGLGQQ